MVTTSSAIPLKVAWGRWSQGGWCELATVDLAHPVFARGGVYVIWYGGPGAEVVVWARQAASLRDRLASHRDDPALQRYAGEILYMTWARVEAARREGVERYLAERLRPLMARRIPNVAPLAVNLPW